mgnify:CR=1 FL=1
MMQTFDEILPAVAGDEEGAAGGVMSELAAALAEATDVELSELVASASAGDTPGMDEALSELGETPADEAAETPADEAAEAEGLEVHAEEAVEPEPELSEEEQAELEEENAAAELTTLSDGNAALQKELKDINKRLQHAAIEAAHLDDAEVADAAGTLVEDLIAKIEEFVDEAADLAKGSSDALDDGDVAGLEKVGERLTEILTEARELDSQAATAVQTVDRGAAAAVDDGEPSDMELWAKSAQ